MRLAFLRASTPAHRPMVEPKFRDHLNRMHIVYRGMVESGRLEDLERVMGEGEWIPSGNGVAPVPPEIAEMTNEIMDELHAAAAKRNKRAARKAIDKLSHWISNIAV